MGNLLEKILNNHQSNGLKILFCLLFFLWSYNNLAYMQSLTEDTMQQAKELSQQEENDTFILEEVIIDSEFGTSFEELKKVTDAYVKQRVSIKDLQQLARQITRTYRDMGYLATIAYVPGQETSDGKVTVKVISGKFGEVTIDNQSKLDTNILNSIKENIRLGEAVEGKYIENVLYRINALGGVKATGKLEKIQNSSDIRLVITVVDHQPTRDIVYAENYGSEYSGRYRFGLIHNKYNIDNKSSNLEAGVLISNKNLKNYHIDYSVIADKKSASRVGISFGRTTYNLTKEYETLDASGTSNDVSLYAKSTIFQTNKDELNLSYGYRFRKISDEMGAYNVSTDKHSHAIYGEVSGYNRVPKGIINYKFKLTAGKLSNDSAYANRLNTYTKTEGNFIKFNGKIDYLQALNKHWNFHTTLSWQQANKFLDGSEKMNIGGINGVRAYSSGDGSGDKGILSRTELIYQTKIKGLSLNAFFDIGSVGNKSKSLNTIKGYGVGVNYQKPNDYFIQFTYARKIGFNENVSSDKDKGKIWFIVGKVF